ncbi:MAG: signal transduction histidine kinase [Desulforhopalus sp.]|jgi:signal transduction histidine kinase
MTIAQQYSVMPKEISALNTYWLVQYLQNYHADVPVEQLVENIASKKNYHVENLETGKMEKVTLQHLQMPRYWFSHEFIQSLHDVIQEHIPDPSLAYKMGRTIYKTQPLIRTTLGVSLLGVHGLTKKISKEAAKYNRTKHYSVRLLKKGYVELRIVHNPGVKVSDFTMQWNAGCFASYGKLAGATDITVEMLCVDSGPTVAGDGGQAIWDFCITYKEPHVLSRLFRGVMLTIPWIRKLTEQAEEIEGEYQEQILTRDKIIRERTERLVAIQEKLIDQERKSIEQKLAQISQELVTTEERERRAIAEDLHDSVTQLLALSVKDVAAVKNNHAEMGRLDTVHENLCRALKDLRSLTFQISPPVLYDFGLEAAIEWLIEDVNSRHSMRLVFTNLIDEPLRLGPQENVILYRIIRELVINIIKHAGTPDGQIILRVTTSQFIAEVADEGTGFDLDCVKNGFGLFSLEGRLVFMNGKIHIMSIPGEGTIIQVRVPLEKLCRDEAQPPVNGK